jgi:hypothetical protein
MKCCIRSTLASVCTGTFVVGLGCTTHTTMNLMDKPPLYGDCVTLETGSDVGQLECAKEAIPHAYRHSDNTEALANVGLCINPSIVTVMGHGLYQGVLCTGDGDLCDYNDLAKYLAASNNTWVHTASNLAVKMDLLELVGCFVGYGQPGADLVSKMADAIKRPVAAPAGNVWCANGMIFADSGLKWQHADPGSKPQPITNPPYRVTAPQFLWFGDEKGRRKIPTKDILIVSLWTPRHKQPVTLSPHDSAELLNRIDFAHPLKHKGAPLAGVTARIKIEIHLGESKRQVRELTIYNYDLAKDSVAPETFYYLDSSFEALLNSLVPAAP